MTRKPTKPTPEGLNAPLGLSGDTAPPTDEHPTIAALPEQSRIYPAKNGGTVASLSREQLADRPKFEIYAVCPEHQTAMIAGTTQAGVTHFYCPVLGCTCQQKVVKPTLYQMLMRQKQTPPPYEPGRTR